MRESEIRPKDIFDEYLRLAEQDVKDFFSGCGYSDIDCPACGEKGRAAFDKKGFKYRICGSCKTLFVSPRPEKAAFNRYYKDAPSTRFWAECFYKKTEDARREKVYIPRVRAVSEKMAMYAPGAGWLVDIGAGYGTFIEEFTRTAKLGFKIIAVEPSDSLSEICSGKGLTVVKKFMEKLEKADLTAEPGTPGVFTSFELLEHVRDPLEFLSSCAGKMSPDDILIFTTLSGTGFDIQLLWENSKSVFPPHHLNFFNPCSIGMLLGRCGLEVLEVTTPGKLDVDIVMSNIRDLDDRFFRTFLESSSEEEREKLQAFLRDNKLSSHMMVVARKKKEKGT
ncbi:MAG: class I SAM-dependent methyltransferase [Candidatus Omnitrophota bacterium]